MTKEELAERLPLIQAFVEGKTIQISFRGKYDWRTEESPNFDSFECIDYRIKPESKTIWLAEDGSIFTEEKHAQDYQEHYKIKCTKYVEVVE